MDFSPFIVQSDSYLTFALLSGEGDRVQIWLEESYETYRINVQV